MSSVAENNRIIPAIDKLRQSTSFCHWRQTPVVSLRNKIYRTVKNIQIWESKKYQTVKNIQIWESKKYRTDKNIQIWESKKYRTIKNIDIENNTDSFSKPNWIIKLSV